MPNFNVFNKDVDNLRVKIFGSNNQIPIQVDASGNLIIGAGTVTVSGGTISALQAGTVTIAGGTLSALQAGTVTISGGTLSALEAGTVTIAGGTVNSTLASRTFTEASETVSSATTALTGATARDVSDKATYSFFVHNTSGNDALVRIEISPDATTWHPDQATVTLSANSTDVLVAQRFLRFVRVAYAAATGGATVTLNVVFQAQV